MNNDKPATPWSDWADANGALADIAAAVFERDRRIAELERENNQLRTSAHVFLEAIKHKGYGMQDAERAVRAALTAYVNADDWTKTLLDNELRNLQ